ncbi:helix-turn-helix domain-containing protein [Halosimplex aquaticum]|uniref:Helix-turn-helix domain-containing protein n=1 Tax=Halosimplex aquaticum TaxID=3026162 RepID=A0ABD5XX25_9EURY|nr:helix-turn-helix domain-containing protein [Halosimplex aquaticum]
MQHVRVRVTAHGREGEIHPVYGIVTNAPFVERALALQWNNAGEDLGILHYVRGDADAFEAAIADVPEVLGYDIERVDDDAFYAYISDDTTASVRELFGSLTTGTVVIVPPIVYHEDGSVTISLFGPDDELQAAVEAIPDPVDVTVEQVGGLDSAAPAVEARLTERQRAAVDAAIDLGYYDVPREAGHEAVADALDCAPSTAAEHLRKAESKLLRGLARSR